MAFSVYGRAVSEPMEVGQGGTNRRFARQDHAAGFRTPKTAFTTPPPKHVMQGKVLPKRTKPLLNQPTMHARPGPPPMSPLRAPPPKARMRLAPMGAKTKARQRMQPLPTPGPKARVFGRQGAERMSHQPQRGYVPTSAVSTAKQMPLGVRAQFSHPVAAAAAVPQAAPVMSLFQAAGMARQTGISAQAYVAPPTVHATSPLTSSGKNAPGLDQLSASKKASINHTPGAPTSPSLPGVAAGDAAAALDQKAKEAMEKADSIMAGGGWQKWAMYGGAAFLAWYALKGFVR